MKRQRDRTKPVRYHVHGCEAFVMAAMSAVDICPTWNTRRENNIAAKAWKTSVTLCSFHNFDIASWTNDKDRNHVRNDTYFTARPIAKIRSFKRSTPTSARMESLPLRSAQALRSIWRGLVYHWQPGSPGRSRQLKWPSLYWAGRRTSWLFWEVLGSSQNGNGEDERNLHCVDSSGVTVAREQVIRVGWTPSLGKEQL